MVSQKKTRPSLWSSYHVCLHDGVGQAHARVGETLIASAGKHLQLLHRLGAVDLVYASLFTFRVRVIGDVLLVNKGGGQACGGVLQRVLGVGDLEWVEGLYVGWGRIDGLWSEITKHAS